LLARPATARVSSLRWRRPVACAYYNDTSTSARYLLRYTRHSCTRKHPPYGSRAIYQQNLSLINRQLFRKFGIQTMNKKSLLLAALWVLASCKKPNAPDPETTAPETVKEMNFQVTGPKAASSAPVQQGSSKFNFIGYGYNVTGKYADTSSVKMPAINIDAYAAAYPNRVDLSHTTSGGAESMYAKDAEDYSYKISSKLNESKGMRLFKHTITDAFPGQDALSDKYIYAQYVVAITWKTIRTNWGDAGVKDYLTPEFKSDVQNLTPENLVKKYGTHILSGVTLGEKFNVYYQAKSTANDKLHSSIVGFTYALKQVFGAASSYYDVLKPAEINAVSEPKLVYEVIGGDPSKINHNVINGKTQVKFSDWVSTCTEDKALFTGVVSMSPLYMLIDDPAKKAEVRDYITSYIEQNQVKL
jgi:hypothetical protein